MQHYNLKKIVQVQHEVQLLDHSVASLEKHHIGTYPIRRGLSEAATNPVILGKLKRSKLVKSTFLTLLK